MPCHTYVGLDVKLITAKPNVIQMFELREIPETAIIMAYCLFESMVGAGIVSKNKYVTAWGQVLNGLSHLHTKKMVHRDLKPENFLIEMNPPFTVIIADFDMAKIATDTVLLQAFCGSESPKVSYTEKQE